MGAIDANLVELFSEFLRDYENDLDRRGYYSAKRVAALMEVGVRHFNDVVALTPGFPKPVRFKLKTGSSQPRYRRSEIHKWLENQEKGVGHKGGRPRKEVE